MWRRPKRRYSRRGPWISPVNKKRDAIQGAHNGDAADPSTWTINAEIKAGQNTIFTYCPTYIPKRYALQENEHVRSQPRTYFSGYKERIHLRLSEPITWRRIVMWSYLRLNTAKPPTKPSANGHHVITRQLTPIPNDPTFRNFMFEGNHVSDYKNLTLHQAMLNKAHYTVIYDKTFQMNTHGAANFEKEFKFWHKGGKLIYDDLESGEDVVGGPGNSGWCSYSREGKGNMYVIDILSNYNPNVGAVIGHMTPTGCMYWAES